MATIQRFEDMMVWQKARELVRETYRALQSCKDYGFRDQIQRAAISVLSNIAEGFERGTKQEFLNYLYIAKGSVGEVRAQLYAASDVGYINIQTFKYLKGLAEECSKLLSSFIYKLKTEGLAGMQRKPESVGEQWFENYLKEAGLVMTGRGMMKQEEAEQKGLEILRR